MSKRSILTWLVVLAAILLIEAAGLWGVKQRDARAYPRAITTIPIRLVGDKCVVVNSSVSRIFAKRGDVVTWVIAGSCAGHRIGVGHFRLKDPADIDPTTQDKREPRVVPATSGQVIQLTLRQTDVNGVYAYDIDVDPPENPPPPPANPPPDDGPVVDVCQEWPCR